MNYKYLGKYHYIYQLSLNEDHKLHLVKIPIVYSNKQYVFIRRLGSYELNKIQLNSFSPYYSGDIYTDFTENTAEKLKNRIIDGVARGYGIVFRFLLEDITPVVEFKNKLNTENLALAYLIKEKTAFENKKKNLINQLNQLDSKLKDLSERIEELEPHAICIE